ncbi:Golgi-body localization protein domain [Nakaseomyces glabratus]|nr:Golgi-body localization protein domain [Nakaseomyces glabratus]
MIELISVHNVLQLLHIAFKVLVTEVLLQAFIWLVLSFFNLPIKAFSFGVLLGPAIRNVLVQFKGVKLTVRSITLRASLQPSIIFNSINVTLSDVIDKGDNDTDQNAPAVPRVRIKMNSWQLWLVNILTKFQFYFANVYITLADNHMIKVDLVSASISKVGKDTTNIEFFAHEIEKGDEFTMNHVIYMLSFKTNRAKDDKEKGIVIELYEWNSYLKTTNTVIDYHSYQKKYYRVPKSVAPEVAEDSKLSSTPQSFDDSIIHKIIDMNRHLIKRLRIIDVKIENIDVVFCPSFKISVSSFQFCLKSMNKTEKRSVWELVEFNSSIWEEYEITLSMNSIICESGPDTCLRLPLVNILITTDCMAHYTNGVPFENLKIVTTINVINPSFFTTSEQVLKLLKTFLIKGSTESKNEDTLNSFPIDNFRMDKFPSFTLEYSFSNFTSTIGLSNEEDLNLSLFNVQAIICHSSVVDELSIPEMTLEKVQWSFIKSSSPKKEFSNYIKIVGLSISYLRSSHLADVPPLSIPLCGLERLDTFIEDVFSKNSRVNSTLRHFSLTLDSLKVVDKLSGFLSKINSVMHDNVSNKNENMPDLESHKGTSIKRKRGLAKLINDLNWTLRFRFKDVTISLIVSGFLPKYLDPIDNADLNLTDIDRGIKITFKESLLLIDNDGKRFSLFNATLSRIIDNINKESEVGGIFVLNDFVVYQPKNSNDISIKLPLVHMKFDVSTLWLIFFLKSIWERYSVTMLNASKEKVKKIKKPTMRKTLRIQANEINIHVMLMSGNPIVFAIEDLNFDSLSMMVSLQNFRLLCKSVYITKIPVLVNLMQIRDLSVDLKKLGEHSAVPITTSLIHFQTEYHLRLYIIIDDIITMFKSYKQIHLAFSNILYYRRLYPSRMFAAKIPKINFSVEKFLIDIEEDPFEQELGLIYKVGVSEQRERIRKEVEFDNEVRKLKEMTPEEQEEFLSRVNNYPYRGRMSENYYIQQARMRLLEHFSTSWIVRYRKAKLLHHQAPYHVEEKRYIDTKYYVYSKERVITTANLIIDNLMLNIGPPSFLVENHMDFIHKYGKGVPKSMEYTLLIMMGMNIYSDLFELNLRDYPIPVMSFSQVKTDGDIVFAEKMPIEDSHRSIFVPFVKSASAVPYNIHNSFYGSHIIRTLNSIKIYYNLNSRTEAATPSFLTWGKSLQPAFESLMLWFDYLTKPPLDPSEKLGFWDKFRFIVHGRWVFKFEKDSSFHLHIKGSYDPYKIADDGAGVSFCWSDNTAVKIHDSSDPKNFLVIDSSRFLLAIRDFTEVDKFEKIFMKLHGNVTWKMGLLFEQGNYEKIGEEDREAPSRPHYDVDLVNPISVRNKSTHDSYSGFRSRFIHMSFGVYSYGANAYNNMFIAPNSFALFLRWWNLFHQYTSGPIRQGPLFTELVQNKNKFGKALFTIKYQLHLEPLIISHTLRHMSSEYSSFEGKNVIFTGLKGRVSSLKMDFHQKRIKLAHIYEKLELTNSVWKFRMFEGEMDCCDADVRIIAAEFAQSKIDDILSGMKKSEIIDRESPQKPLSTGNDEWFDLHDYHDVDHVPLDSEPVDFKAEPLLYSPRMSYFRKINEDGFPVSYPFGDEDSHVCLIGRNHPESTQKMLARERKLEIETRLSEIESEFKDFECSKMTESHKYKLKELQSERHELKHSLHIIHNILRDLRLSEEISRIYTNDDLESSIGSGVSSVSSGRNTNNEAALLRTNTIESFVSMRKNSSVNAVSSYDNRFMLHNIHLKINKSITHHLLDYIHNWYERKSMRFFMTYKSICIVEELLKLSLKGTKSRFQEYGSLSEFFKTSNAEFIEQFDRLNREVSNDSYEAIDSFLFRLVSPQVQIRSDCEPNDALILSARDIEVGIIDINQIYGENGKRLPTDVDTIVETRYCVVSKDLQLFALFKNDLIKHGARGFKSHGYGLEENSTFWPPWIPLEMCYDGSLLEKNVVLRRRSMYLTFTAPNSLYFSQRNDQNIVTTCSNIRIAFPGLLVTSTSQQYCSVYAIVQDLLAFASSADEKIEKLSRNLIEDEIRNSLESLDISHITNLQDRVRNMYHVRAYMKLNEPSTYNEFLPLINFEAQVSIIKLTLLMTAIKETYNKLGSNDTSNPQKLVWQISTEDLIWELFDEKKSPFVTIGLGPSKFIRVETSDGNNTNVVSINSLKCFNQQENPIFSELFAPDFQHSHYHKDMPMVEISWVMGNPIGGISDLNDLTVILQPSIFKMDHKTGDHLMSYLFPDVNSANVESDDSLSISSPRKSNSSIVSPAPAISYYGMSSILSAPRDSGSWDVSSIKALSASGSGRSPSPEDDKIDRQFLNINEMVQRSGEYFTVRNIKIKHTYMSVSYKGSRAIFTDVNKLKIKVPTLRYHNKIWSRDELFDAIKKDVVRIVIQHLGSIIGNKFLPHKKEDKKSIKKKYTEMLKSDEALNPELAGTISNRRTLTSSSSKTTTDDNIDSILFEGDSSPIAFYPGPSSNKQ